MSEKSRLGLALAGELIGTDFAGWTDELVEEFRVHAEDGNVGSRLLSEDARVRVWEIRLAPGERWHFHRHVLDYFWTAITAGSSIQHTHDGTTRAVHYEVGETRHFVFARGEFLLHDIENVGEADLVFTTVEHLDSENSPLPIKNERRLKDLSHN